MHRSFYRINMEPKILTTGTSRGLGKYLYKEFSKLDVQVEPFTRSNTVEEKIDKLFAFAESGLQVEIDLINQNIHCSDEDLISFEIDEFRKQQILEGLDEVGISLKYSDEIKNFEKQRELEAPWVFKS